jgi:hypothetical protein
MSCPPKATDRMGKLITDRNLRKALIAIALMGLTLGTMQPDLGR